LIIYPRQPQLCCASHVAQKSRERLVADEFARTPTARPKPRGNCRWVKLLVPPGQVPCRSHEIGVRRELGQRMFELELKIEIRCGRRRANRHDHAIAALGEAIGPAAAVGGTLIAGARMGATMDHHHEGQDPARFWLARAFCEAFPATQLSKLSTSSSHGYFGFLNVCGLGKRRLPCSVVIDKINPSAFESSAEGCVIRRCNWD
jgi:hypothetical protein